MIKIKKLTFTLLVGMAMVMALFPVTGPSSHVYAENNSGLIQLNGMSSVDVDGWTTYGTQVDSTANAGKIKLTTPESITPETMVNSGGQNKCEYTGLAAGSYTFTVIANEGYSANVNVGGSNTSLTPVVGQSGKYTFTVTVPENSNTPIMVNPAFNSGNLPGPGPEPGEKEYIDIEVYQAGEATTYPAVKISDGGIIELADGIDVDNFNFKITKLYHGEDDASGTVITGCSTKSGDFTPDEENRNPLEIYTTQTTSKSKTMNLEFHDATNPFYFINLTFAEADTDFINIESTIKPFMLDDMIAPDKVALSGTDENNPAEFTVYYSSGTVTFADLAGELPVTDIEIVDDMASGAITIYSNETLAFNSPYYNSVLLKVTVSDETETTVGYVRINRVGIEIRDYDFNGGTDPENPNRILHGSQPGPIVTDPKYTNKCNIIASFYFDASKTHGSYDIVSIATFADGHTETSVVEGFETSNGSADNTQKVGDYILWTGSRANAPVKVSATAVNHGATVDADSFGGVSFGAGMGVTKKIGLFR